MFYLSETKKLNETTRATLNGEFIELSNGFTRYEEAGPENGPIIVLVHGFSVPYYIWEHNFYALAEAGFRVIRYDLFGRGGSDRPSVNYDMELFVKQLTELTEQLIPKNKTFNILCVCMGSIISAEFAKRYPNKVDKILMVGPAGIPGSLPANHWVTKIPIWGEYLMQLWGDQELVSSLKKHLYRFNLYPEYKEQYLMFMEFSGLKKALLSTIRSIHLEDMVNVYKEIGKQKHEFCLVWGIEDKIVPIRLSELMTEILPKATFHSITDAGHVANYEQPKKFNQIAIKFFNQ